LKRIGIYQQKLFFLLFPTLFGLRVFNY
jgi:hypothetical protein